MGYQRVVRTFAFSILLRTWTYVMGAPQNWKIRLKGVCSLMWCAEIIQTIKGKLHLRWILFYRLWHVCHLFSLETMVYYHYHMELGYSCGTIILFWSQPDNSSLTYMKSGTHGMHKAGLKFHPLKILMLFKGVKSRTRYCRFSKNRNKVFSFGWL